MNTPGRTRLPRRRHSALQGLEVGVWHPEGVGKVPGYPKSAEAHEEIKRRLAGYTEEARANGILSRQGVPNGYAGRKPELEVLRRNSQTEAEMLTAEMLPPPTCDDEWYGNLAMTALLAVALDTSVTQTLRIRAAGIALPFLLPKPARVAAIGGFADRGLAFLAGLVAAHKATPDKS